MEPYWFEVAVMATIYALGTILLGHFEEGVPKWRRVIKFFALTGLAVLISAMAGRAWFYGFLGVGAAFALVVHGWYLPRHGINPWTAEPRDRYYELSVGTQRRRGRKKSGTYDHDKWSWSHRRHENVSRALPISIRGFDHNHWRDAEG